jgi:hypothetical protein
MTHDTNWLRRPVVWRWLAPAVLRVGVVAASSTVPARGAANLTKGCVQTFDATELARGAGTALVRGNGPRAAMAAAVREREGYSLAPAADPHYDVCIETDESGWHLSSDGGEHQGADFASLATFLRHRRSDA